MKKILVCIQDFKQGGIPRCLQSLLCYYDTSRYDIDVFCLSHEGDYRDQMPNCTILTEDKIVKNLMVFTKRLSAWQRIFHLYAIFLKTLRSVMLKLTKKDILFFRLATIGKQLSKKKNYDVAIAYAEGFPTKLVESMNVRRKLVWIHNDYAFDGARSSGIFTDFSKFDKICCVSKATYQSFCSFFPQYADKTTVLYNLINYDYITRLSRENIDDVRFSAAESDKRIVSIGRVCAQKNFQVIPEIYNKLARVMDGVKWFILGDGPDGEKQLLINEIERLHLSGKVILLGNKPNPYSYLAKADLFVLTSVYESYPTVINEAKALGIPIVAHDIPCVHEMMTGHDGVATSLVNMHNAIISQLLTKSNEETADRRTHEFWESNKRVLQGFYTLLEE